MFAATAPISLPIWRRRFAPRPMSVPARRLPTDASRSDTEVPPADVCFEAWRQAARFDAARGSAVTWLLTLVRSRAR